jgi:hypothetical protein
VRETRGAGVGRKDGAAVMGGAPDWSGDDGQHRWAGPDQSDNDGRSAGSERGRQARALGRSVGAHRGSVDWAGLLDLGDGAVLFITLGDE